MIVYNNEWLDNMYVRELADEALHEKTISAESHQDIYIASPVGFYTPNVYARIGLAAGTFLIVFFSLGFLALLLASALSNSGNVESVAGVLLIIAGGACLAVAMSYITGSHHYNSGADNMLVWLSGALVFAGIAVMCSGHTSVTVLSLAGLVISIALTLLFTDRLMSVVAFFCLLSFVFSGYAGLGDIALSTAPFLMMVVCAGIFYFIITREPEYPLYRNCFYYVKLACLVALYASGNYLVVSALSSRMIPYSSFRLYHLPMGWLFWSWTFIVPAAYIWIGTRYKSLMLIRTGILLVVAAILTFRQYHSVLPIEIALTLAGIILIVVSYLLINYLKTPHGRFTFQPGYSGNEKTPIEQLLERQLLDDDRMKMKH